MYNPINELSLNDKLYNDVVIIVASKKYGLHKKILSDKSEFFKMLFLKENNHEYNINFITNYEVFEIIIKIIYGIKIYSLEFEIYVNVLNCLNYLLMEPINVPLITDEKRIFFRIDGSNHNSAVYLDNKFILSNKKTNEVNLNKMCLSKIKKYIESYRVHINENFNILISYVIPSKGLNLSYRNMIEDKSAYWPYYKVKISFSEDDNDEIKFWNKGEINTVEMLDKYMFYEDDNEEIKFTDGEIDITEIINKYIIDQLKIKKTR